MTTINNHNAKSAARQWLLDRGQRLDLFGTLTMKQALKNGHGSLAWLTPEEARKDLRHWLNLVTREVYGNNATRRGLGIERIVVLEGGDGIKRLHPHFLMGTPEGLSQQEFINLLIHKWRQCDWSHSKLKIEPAEDRTAVTTYLQKTGFDAVQMDLTWFHQ